MISIMSFAQSAKTTPAKKVLTGIDKVMTEIGYPYTKVNDSIATITFTGEVVKSYDLSFFKTGGLYITYINLSKLPGLTINESKYKYLLTCNTNFDLIKVGLEEDGTAFIRCETYVNGALAGNLKRIIDQVGNAVEEVASKLK